MKIVPQDIPPSSPVIKPLNNAIIPIAPITTAPPATLLLKSSTSLCLLSSTLY